MLLYKFLFRLVLVYWRIFNPHSRSASCLIEYQGKILLVRNTYGDMKWGFPGGGCKRGEKPEETVRREVQEEVGIVLDDLQQIGVCTGTTLNKNAVIHCFYGQAQGADFRIDRNEIYEAGWFDWANLPQDLSLSTKRMLKIYNSK